MSESVSGICVHYDGGMFPRVRTEIVTTTPGQGPYHTLTIGPATYFFPLGDAAEELGREMVMVGAALMQAPKVIAVASQAEEAVGAL